VCLLQGIIYPTVVVFIFFFLFIFRKSTEQFFSSLFRGLPGLLNLDLSWTQININCFLHSTLLLPQKLNLTSFSLRGVKSEISPSFLELERACESAFSSLLSLDLFACKMSWASLHMWLSAINAACPFLNWLEIGENGPEGTSVENQNSLEAENSVEFSCQSLDFFSQNEAKTDESVVNNVDGYLQVLMLLQDHFFSKLQFLGISGVIFPLSSFPSLKLKWDKFHIHSVVHGEWGTKICVLEGILSDLLQNNSQAERSPLIT
jgi:hypothetical protein